MIPTHDIPLADKKDVRMNELLTLTHYDSGEPHRHAYFEFFVFLKGGGTHVIDFTEFPVQSHAIHIVAPGQVHEVKRELDSKGFVFLFERDHFAAFPQIEHFLLDHSCLDVKECPPGYYLQDFSEEVGYLVQQSWREYNSGHAFRQDFVFNNLSQLLLLCMRNKFEAGEGAIKNDNNAAFRRVLNK